MEKDVPISWYLTKMKEVSESDIYRVGREEKMMVGIRGTITFDLGVSKPCRETEVDRCCRIL